MFDFRLALNYCLWWWRRRRCATRTQLIDHEMLRVNEWALVRSIRWDCDLPSGTYVTIRNEGNLISLCYVIGMFIYLARLLLMLINYHAVTLRFQVHLPYASKCDSLEKPLLSYEPRQRSFACLFSSFRSPIDFFQEHYKRWWNFNNKCVNPFNGNEECVLAHPLRSFLNMVLLSTCDNNHFSITKKIKLYDDNESSPTFAPATNRIERKTKQRRDEVAAELMSVATMSKITMCRLLNNHFFPSSSSSSSISICT